MARTRVVSAPLTLLVAMVAVVAVVVVASPDTCGTATKPAATCADIYQTRPTAPSGQYRVVDRTARGASLSRTTELVYCDMESGGLQLMAKASRGYPFDYGLTWATLNDELNSDNSDVLTTPDLGSNSYYSRQRNCWNGVSGTACDVDYVVVRWYKDGKVAAFMMFDAVDQTEDQVFSINNLIASSWTDLTSASSDIGEFNVDGSDESFATAYKTGAEAGPTFCDTAVIWALGLYSGQPCTYAGSQFPQFAFSTASTAKPLSDPAIAYADTIAIFAHSTPKLPSADSCASEGLKFRAFVGSSIVTGTTVKDQSGQSVVLTSHGAFQAATADWVDQDKVAYFASPASYVSAPVQVTSTGFTVSFMFQSAAAAHGSVLASQCNTDTSVACAWEIQYITQPAPGVRARITYSGLPKRASNSWDVTAPAPGGLWHHVVLTWTSTTGVADLHVDGRRTMAYVGKSFSLSTSASQLVYIGQSFTGRMYDFRLFSSAVAESTGASIWDAYSYLLSVTNTWLQWRMGPDTGKMLPDLSLSDNHGAVQGGTNRGAAVALTQAHPARIVSAKPVFDAPTGDTTIAAWIYLDFGVLFDDPADLFCAASITFAPDANDNYQQLALCMYKRQIAILTGSTTTMYIASVPAGSSILRTAQWHHVAVSYTWGSASSIRVFVDGVQFPTITQSNALTLTYTDAGSIYYGKLVLGTSPFNSGLQDWAGSFGSVDVLLNMLDSAGAQQLYNKGLLTRWNPAALVTPLKESASNTYSSGATRVFDLSHMQANVGIVSGTPSVQSGFLKLAATDSIVGQSPTALAADDHVTLMAWVYYDAASLPSGVTSIVMVGPGTVTTTTLNTQLGIILKDSYLAVNFGEESDLLSSTTFTTRTWHHVAFTKAPGSKTVFSRLYLDGKSVPVILSGDMADLNLASETFLKVGKYVSRWNSLVGYVDDVQLFRRQLSDDDIATYYAATRAQHGRELAFHGNGVGDFLEMTSLSLTAAGITFDMMIMLPSPADIGQNIVDMKFANGRTLSLWTEASTGIMVYSTNSTAGVQAPIRSTYAFPQMAWTRVTIVHNSDNSVLMYWNDYLQASGTSPAPAASSAATLRIGHKIYYDQFEMHTMLGSVSKFEIYSGGVALSSLNAPTVSVTSAALVKLAFQPSSTSADPFELFDETSTTVDNTIASKPDGRLWCSGVCLTKASSLMSICGDGLRRGKEGCDDGNQLPGDGCSPACFVEDGFSCQSASPWEADLCTAGAVRFTEDFDAPVPPSKQDPKWTHIAHNSGNNWFNGGSFINGDSNVNDASVFVKPCANYNYMGSSWIIKIKMGNVIDYYRPQWGQSLCDILAGTSTSYSWSPTFDGDYTPVDPATDDTDLIGGSAIGFPGTVNSADTRHRTSSWASVTTRLGGCCHSSSPTYGSTLSPSGEGDFQQAYDMYVYHILPEWKRYATVAATDTMTATTYTDGTDTVASCETYKWMGRKFIIRVTMGANVDFFRPHNQDADHLCQLLTGSPDRFMWSRTFDSAPRQPTPFAAEDLGGGTPLDGEGRSSLPKWGTTTGHAGGFGHMHSIYADGQTDTAAWGRAFTIDIISTHLMIGCENQFDTGGWALVRRITDLSNWWDIDDNARGTAAQSGDMSLYSLAPDRYSFKYGDLAPTEVMLARGDWSKWMVIDYSSLSTNTAEAVTRYITHQVEQLDENGDPVLDENGDPVMVTEQEQQVDADGNPVVDGDGNPVMIDKLYPVVDPAVAGSLAVKRSSHSRTAHTVDWFNRASVASDPVISDVDVVDPDVTDAANALPVLYREKNADAVANELKYDGINVYVRSPYVCTTPSWQPVTLPPGAIFQMAQGAARLDGYGLKLGFSHAGEQPNNYVVASRYVTDTITTDTVLTAMFAVQKKNSVTQSSPLVVTLRDSYATGRCLDTACDGDFYRVCVDVGNDAATALKCDLTVNSNSPQWERQSWRVGSGYHTKNGNFPSAFSLFIMAVATTADVEVWIDSLTLVEQPVATSPHCYDVKVTSSSSSVSATIDGAASAVSVSAGQVLLVTQRINAAPTVQAINLNTASAWRTALNFLPDHTYVAGGLKPGASSVTLGSDVLAELRKIGVAAPKTIPAGAKWAFAGHRGAPYPSGASNFILSGDSGSATIGDVFSCAQFVSVGPWPSNRVGMSTDLPRRGTSSAKLAVRDVSPQVATAVTGTTLSFPQGVSSLQNATITSHVVGISRYFHYGPFLFGAANGINSYREIAHGLTGTLHDVQLRVRVRVSTGDHAGAIFGCTGASWLTSAARETIGGCVAALTPTAVRIWAPSTANGAVEPSVSSRIVLADGSIGGGAASITAREAFTEVEIVPELPADFDSGWVSMSSNAGDNSYKEVSHGLGVLPARVKVLVKATDGNNNGAIFEAFGMSNNEDVSTVPYGGLVYSYSSSKVRLWAPTSTPTRANATGYIVHVGAGWGGDLQTQASHSAQIRVMAWLDVGTPDFYSSWSPISQDGGASYFHELHGFDGVPARVSVRFRSVNATGVHNGYVFDALPTWQIGLSARGQDYTSVGTTNAGVVYAYGNATIRVWAATGLSKIIRTGRGWGNGKMRAEETKAEVEIRAWKSDIGATDVGGLNVNTVKVNAPPKVQDVVKVVADVTQERGEIVRVPATDGDSPFLTYSLVYGNKNIFSVDQVSGAIFLLDRTAFSTTRTQYMLSVAVSDGIMQDVASVTLKRNITVPLVPVSFALNPTVLPYGKVSINMVFASPMTKMLATVQGKYDWTNETSQSVVTTIDESTYAMQFDLPVWSTNAAPILPPENAIPYPRARIVGSIGAHAAGVRPENAAAAMNILAGVTNFNPGTTDFPRCPATDKSHNRHVWSSVYPVFHKMTSVGQCCHSCNGTNYNTCAGWMMIDGYCYHATTGATIQRASDKFKERYSDFYAGPTNMFYCDPGLLGAPLTHVGTCGTGLGNECNLACDSTNPQKTAGTPYICELDGVGGTNWVDGVAPTCTFNCSRPILPSGFRLGACTNNYLDGSTCTGQCAPGWGLISGSGDTTCSETGWSPISAVCARDCGAMPAPTHGVANACSSTVAGSTCTSSCNAGYTATSGALTRQCLDDGTWSDSVAICTHDCGTPPTFSNGKFSYTSSVAGSTATATCNVGYVLGGTKTTITCVDGPDSASWDSFNVVCIGSCGSPSIPNGGTTCTDLQWIDGNECPVVCNSGFTLEGSSTLTCSQGTWNGFAQCKASCGDPPTYGTVVVTCAGGAMQAGVTCTFACAAGSTLIAGEKSAVCTQDGWVGAPPVCVPNCPNGKLDAGEECDDGNLINTDGCTNKCNLIGDTYSLTGVMALMGAQATMAARTADQIFVAHAATQSMNPDTSTMPLQRPVVKEVRLMYTMAVSDASVDSGMGVLVKPHQLEDLIVDNHFMTLNASFDTTEYQWEDLAGLVLAALPDPLTPLLMDTEVCDKDTDPILTPYLTGDVTGDGKADVIQALYLGGKTCFRVWPSEKGNMDYLVSCGSHGVAGTDSYWAAGKVSTGASRASVIRQSTDPSFRLCTTYFTFDNKGRVTSSSQSCVTRSSATAQWLHGDIAGNGVISFVQVMAAAAGATQQCYYKYLSAAAPAAGDSLTCVTVTNAYKWFLAKVASTQLDLVAVSPNSDGHQACLNYWTGASSFATKTQRCTGQAPDYQDWFVADVDNDSHGDLVQMLPNSGASVGCFQYFKYTQTYSTKNGPICTGSASTRWYMADIDADSKVDIMQFYEDPNDDMQTCWFVSRASTGFAKASMTQVCDTRYSRPEAILVADLQTDSKADVTFAHVVDGSICLQAFQAGISGAFVASQTCRASTDFVSWTNHMGQPVDRLYGDLDGDSKQDALRIFYNGGYICWQVWWGSSSWLSDSVVCSAKTKPTSVMEVTYVVGNVLDAGASEAVLVMTVSSSSRQLCITSLDGVSGTQQASQCYNNHPTGFIQQQVSAGSTALVGRSVDWKVVDINKNGVKDLVHIYLQDNGQMAMEWFSNSLATRRGGNAFDDTRGYREFLYGDVNNNGYVDIVQIYSLYSQLCYVMWEGGSDFTCNGNDCVGTCSNYGDATIAWFAGSANTDLYADLIQVYDNIVVSTTGAPDTHQTCVRVFPGSSNGITDPGTSATRCLAPVAPSLSTPGFYLDGALFWALLDVNGDGADDVVEVFKRDNVPIGSSIYDYAEHLPGDVCFRWLSGNANWAYQTPICSMMMQGDGAWALAGNVDGTGLKEFTQVYTNEEGKTCFTIHSLSSNFHLDTCAVGKSAAGPATWLYMDASGNKGDEQVAVIDTANGLCLAVYAEADNFQEPTVSCVGTSIQGTLRTWDAPQIGAGQLIGTATSKEEIVVGWQTSTGRSWMVLTTGTTPAIASTSSASGANRPFASLLVDVTGDGKQDIVEPFADANGRLSIRLISSVSPSFVSDVYPYTSQAAHSLAWLTGDFNGDTYPDVLRVYNISSAVCFYLFRGAATLDDALMGVDAWCPTGQPTDSLKWFATDINADGWVDIVQVMERNMYACFTWYNWKDKLPRGGCSDTLPSPFPFLPVTISGDSALIQAWQLHNQLCYSTFSGASGMQSHSARCMAYPASVIDNAFGAVTLDDNTFRMLNVRNYNGHKCTVTAI